MSRDYKTEYDELLKTRNQLDINIIKQKKYNAYEYFETLGVNVENLQKNMTNSITLFSAPLKNIHGTNMANWPTIEGSEIYIDNGFISNPNNNNVISCQLTHEVLHSLSRKIGIGQNFFGHNDISYQGVDEFSTQMFTEEIENRTLSEEEDYMYFGKKVMKQLADIIGIDKLAEQYLDNNNTFELEFDKLSNISFFDFSKTMTEVYELLKKERYSIINIDEKQYLETRKEQIDEFINFLYENKRLKIK